MPRKRVEKARRFMSSSTPYAMPTEDREAFTRALDGKATGRDLATIEGLIVSARRRSAHGIDEAPGWTTTSGKDELTRLETHAKALLDALNTASDEAQGFLGIDAHDRATDALATFWVATRLASRKHARVRADEKRSQTDGRLRKEVALDLARGLLPIWEKRSGKRFAHRGPWGHFVELAFRAAGIKASAEGMAIVCASSDYD